MQMWDFNIFLENGEDGRVVTDTPVGNIDNLLERQRNM